MARVTCARSGPSHAVTPVRIAIIGNAGGGKSTLARKLAQSLDLPVFHVDSIQYQPGWKRTPQRECDELLNALTQQERWIIDGFGSDDVIERLIAYLDSSVLLRIILGQRDRLEKWDSVVTGVGSALVEVECLRTFDRLRLRRDVPNEALALRRETVYRLTEEMVIIEPDRTVLNRAAQPFPTPLGTLGPKATHLNLSYRALTNACRRMRQSRAADARRSAARQALETDGW